MTIVDFIQKLILMLEEDDNSIEWNLEGNQFCVNNSEQFAQRLLPKYFRHKKFQSFVRQLNMYGFNKICRQKNSISFRHKNFIRNEAQKMNLIARKKRTYSETIQQDQYEKNYVQLVNKNFEKNPCVSNLFKQLISFKSNTNQLMKKIKFKIEGLNRQLNGKKSKNLKPQMKQIRQRISFLDEYSLNLDTTLQGNLNQLQQKPEKQFASELSLNVNKRASMIFNESQKKSPELIKENNSSKRQQKQNNLPFGPIGSFNSIGSFIS